MKLDCEIIASAFSKAIVTEPLHFQITGDFKNESNYLEFTNSEEAVNSVARLFEDKKMRSEMFVDNFKYYQTYVRPDALVLNSFATVYKNVVDF